MGFEENFIAGERVEIRRGSRLLDPFSGEVDGEIDWGPDGEGELVVERFPVPVLPDTSSAATEIPLPTSPEHAEDMLSAFMAYQTDVTREDKLKILTGRYAGLYPIDSVNFYLNPFTGEEAICWVTVLRKKG